MTVSHSTEPFSSFSKKKPKVQLGESFHKRKIILKMETESLSKTNNFNNDQCSAEHNDSHNNDSKPDRILDKFR